MAGGRAGCASHERKRSHARIPAGERRPGRAHTPGRACVRIGVRGCMRSSGRVCAGVRAQAGVGVRIRRVHPRALIYICRSHQTHLPLFQVCTLLDFLCRVLGLR